MLDYLDYEDIQKIWDKIYKLNLNLSYKILVKAEANAKNKNKIAKREDLLTTWEEKGNNNLWIKEAYDPPFNQDSFLWCDTSTELKLWLAHGNWSIGSAFCLGNLAFINQVNGGDEYLVIKEKTVFESISAEAMLKSGSFDGWLKDVQNASIKDCKNLTYSRS